MKDALVQVRVDQETKTQIDTLFSSLGMDTATAIRVFFRQAILASGLPFEVRQRPSYNATTEAALSEGDAIANGSIVVPTYRSWSDFEASLDGDE